MAIAIGLAVAGESLPQDPEAAAALVRQARAETEEAMTAHSAPWPPGPACRPASTSAASASPVKSPPRSRRSPTSRSPRRWRTSPGTAGPPGPRCASRRGLPAAPAAAGT
ncbi:hypothetical protein ACFW6F_26475 [Streptomyces sp. NPDC058746]|uniref:hypothetical protein n=1 Tax=Streptomyces sp. NPDC058746 TaxID=3346622 RepID=UPI0036C249BF